LYCKPPTHNSFDIRCSYPW